MINLVTYEDKKATLLRVLKQEIAMTAGIAA